MPFPFTLYYNINADSLYNLAEAHRLSERLEQRVAQSRIQKLVLRQSPNQGKDIGGKLVLLDACLRSEDLPDHCIFLHDKKSPHQTQGKEWRTKLFQVIEPSFVEKALKTFENDPAAGIIAPAANVHNEYDHLQKQFKSNNRALLAELMPAWGIHTTDYRYVAGTMFWMRMAPLQRFLTQYPPLDIRQTLEKGNVLDDFEGTHTHSWERLLSWLIFAQGYTIKGL